MQVTEMWTAIEHGVDRERSCEEDDQDRGCVRRSLVEGRQLAEPRAFAGGTCEGSWSCRHEGSSCRQRASGRRLSFGARRVSGAGRMPTTSRYPIIQTSPIVGGILSMSASHAGASAAYSAGRAARPTRLTIVGAHTEQPAPARTIPTLHSPSPPAGAAQQVASHAHRDA